MSWKSLTLRESYVHAKMVGVWGIGLLAFGMYYIAYNQIDSPSMNVLGADAVILSLQLSLGNVLPIGGLMLGYRTIVDERLTGRIKLTAAMPYSRQDIIIGKTVSVALPLVVIIAVMFLVATGLAVFTAGLPSPTRLVGFAVVSVVYAVLCAGLGVLLSTLTSSSIRATGVMLLSLATLLLWKSLGTRLYALLTGTAINPFHPPADGALFLLRRVDPRNAYFLTTNWIYDVGNGAGVYDGVLAKLHPGPNTVASVNTFVVETTFEHPPPYLAEALGVVILVAWLVLPISLAVSRFQTTSLS